MIRQLAFSSLLFTAIILSSIFSCKKATTTSPAFQNLTMKTYPVGNAPTGIIFDGTYLWTVENGGNTVSKDSLTGSVILTCKTTKNPIAIAYNTNDSCICAANGDSLTIINLKGVIDTTINGNLNSYPTGISYAKKDSSIWIANKGINSLLKFKIQKKRKIVKKSDGKDITIISYKVDTTLYLTGPNITPNGIAYDGDNMWVTDQGKNSVTKVTSTGTMTTYFGTGEGPTRIAFDGINMWTANNRSNSVTKISPSGEMTIFKGTGDEPMDIAFDGINMWTANAAGNSVTKITPSGEMVNYKEELPAGTSADIFPKNPFGPTAITFDGKYIWTANTADNSITKITVK